MTSSENIYPADDASAVAGRASRIGLLIGVVGLAAAWFLGSAEDDHMRHFWMSYLVAFFLLVTFTMGGMFFVLIQHITGAKWSVTVRRQAEFIMGAVPFVGLLAIPFLIPLFSHDGVEHGGLLWSWVHPHGEHQALIEGKVGFLNREFFVGRLAFYFVIWSIIARYFKKNSLAQDADGDEARTVAMRKRSAVCIIIFALSISFAGFDLIMSTDPAWFSTIFGVYIFAGCVISIHALLTLSSMFLQRKGHLKGMVTVEHYHDLGKMMMAFTIFWAYIAFSQYFLYWYANMPEETAWYLRRIGDEWGYLSWFQLFGHFVIPFLGILSRHVKRNRKLLCFWAVYMLTVQAIDLYWLVAPNLYPEGSPFSMVEVCTFTGMLGLFVFAVYRQATKHSILAHRDPLMDQCLAFKNF